MAAQRTTCASAFRLPSARVSLDLVPVDTVVVDQADQDVDAGMLRIGSFQETVEVFRVGRRHMAHHFDGEQVHAIGIDATDGRYWIKHHGLPNAGRACCLEERNRLSVVAKTNI